MLALIVDDSRAMRSLLGQALRGLGFQIVEARDGAEGLDRLRESAGVAVALVDRNMPVKDGISFVREVRRLPGFVALPLVMVTTEGDADKVELARASGADEYVTKPFTSDIIAHQLERLGLPLARA